VDGTSIATTEAGRNVTMERNRLTPTWWALKIAFGLVPFLAGLDKFFNVLTNWTDYLNPAVLEHVPVTSDVFMRGVGIVEMLVGLMILTLWTRAGAYLAALWLAAIAVNLITMGKFLDIAARDLVLSVAAFSLARLTEARRSEAEAPSTARANPSEGGLLRLNL
jgi:hypothetical protein